MNVDLHPSYPQLRAKLRLGPLTLTQYVQLGVSFLLAYGLVALLQGAGLSGQVALSFGIFLAGLPVVLAIAGDGPEFDALGYVGALIAWVRAPKAYDATAPAVSALGYVVADPPAPTGRREVLAQRLQKAAGR